MQENISYRLKLFIDSQGISMREFETIFGFSNGSIGSQIKNNKAIGSDRVEKILLHYEDLNPHWLLTGKGPMLLSDAVEDEPLQVLSEPLPIYGNKKIPLFESVVVAGTNAIANDSLHSEMVHPGDFFSDANAVIKIYGDSMEPRYPSGSYVPVKRIENKDLLIYGQDYVIQTSEYRVLKRVQKSSLENNILACSINQEMWQHGELSGKLIHEPFDINKDEILSIFAVLGCITKNQLYNVQK
jgi:hypothetical protein